MNRSTTWASREAFSVGSISSAVFFFKEGKKKTKNKKETKDFGRDRLLFVFECISRLFAAKRACALCAGRGRSCLSGFLKGTAPILNGNSWGITLCSLLLQYSLPLDPDLFSSSTLILPSFSFPFFNSSLPPQ